MYRKNQGPLRWLPFFQSTLHKHVKERLYAVVVLGRTGSTMGGVKTSSLLVGSEAENAINRGLATRVRCSVVLASASKCDVDGAAGWVRTIGYDSV